MFNFLELSHPLQTIFHTHGCNLLQDPNNDEFLLNLFADLKSFDEICDRMLLHLVRKLHASSPRLIQQTHLGVTQCVLHSTTHQAHAH